MGEGPAPILDVRIEGDVNEEASDRRQIPLAGLEESRKEREIEIERTDENELIKENEESHVPQIDTHVNRPEKHNTGSHQNRENQLLE